MKLSHLEGDTSTQMSMMDGKARQLVEDLKAATTTAHGSLHAERERLEQRLLNMIDKNMASTDVQMVGCHLCCSEYWWRLGAFLVSVMGGGCLW